MRMTLIILVLFKVWLVFILKSNNATELKYTNIRCTAHNKTLITINVCRLKALSRNKAVVNLNVTILYPVSVIEANVQLLKKANGYKPWLYNTSVDWCQFNKKPYNPVIIALIRDFREACNFFHPCPYVGDQIIDKQAVDSKIVLPYPTGEYLLKIDVFFYHKKQVSVDTYYRVDEGILDSWKVF